MVYYHVDDLSNTTIHFLMFFGQFSMYSIKLYLSINKPNDGELFLNITSLILYYISNIIQSQHLFKSCRMTWNLAPVWIVVIFVFVCNIINGIKLFSKYIMCFTFKFLLRSKLYFIVFQVARVIFKVIFSFYHTLSCALCIFMKTGAFPRIFIKTSVSTCRSVC